METELANHLEDSQPVRIGNYHPRMSNNGLEPTYEVEILDHKGDRKTVFAAGELPLTIKVDGQEIVTLMTLGTHPEKLVLGYIRNQRMASQISDIASIEVNWDTETAEIATRSGNGVDSVAHPRRKIITTGCGQGTVYSCTLDKLYEHRLVATPVRQSEIYRTLKNIVQHNQVYRKAGSVHGCALVLEGTILYFVEDVGRHNATDTIAGEMWLDNEPGADKMFYTTGRLTSEIVMKAAMMGIPALVSRNGVTQMAIELANDLNVMLIARAKSRHFQVFTGHERLILDN